MQNTKSTAQILSEILQSYSLKSHSKQKGKLHETYQTILMLLQKEFRDELAGTPFQSGSLAKGTAINVKFDLDMVVPFKRGAFDSPEEMFKSVGKVLQKAGHNPRHQRVSFGIKALKVSDSKTMLVDVVPGLQISGNHLHLYNRETKSNIQTNLELQLRYFNDQKNDVLDIVRFMKIWKYHHPIHSSVKSFMLELLTIHAQNNRKVNGLPNKLLWNFEHISNFLQTNQPLYAPGNKSDDILADIKPDTRKNIANRMQNLHKKMSIAFEDNAIKSIKKMFPVAP